MGGTPRADLKELLVEGRPTTGRLTIAVSRKLLHLRISQNLPEYTSVMTAHSKVSGLSTPVAKADPSSEATVLSTTGVLKLLRKMERLKRFVEQPIEVFNVQTSKPTQDDKTGMVSRPNQTSMSGKKK